MASHFFWGDWSQAGEKGAEAGLMQLEPVLLPGNKEVRRLLVEEAAIEQTGDRFCIAITEHEAGTQPPAR